LKTSWADLNPETGENSPQCHWAAFILPGRIVEYMVDESLIQYLLSRTRLQEPALRQLLD
jgi:hypothetical protein